MPEKVAVIIPFFNRAHFLADTIRSVAAQTYPYWRLILVDDGSTDGSSDVAELFRDPRIRLIRLKKRVGKARAINQALSWAQEQWITFFDSDDLMSPSSLEKRVAFLKKNPRELGVMGRVGHLIDASGKKLRETHPLSTYSRQSIKIARRLMRHCGGLLPEIFVYGQCPVSPMSATLFRFDAIKTMEPIDARLVPWEDRDYLMRVAWRRPIPFLDTPVMKYRVHNYNASFKIRKNRLFHPKAAWLQQQLEKKYTRLIK